MRSDLRNFVDWNPSWILEAANGGATKTKIMYKLQEYLCTATGISFRTHRKHFVRVLGGEV
ncbi:MAG: winged helix-turn-helix domain-containing protein [Thermoproteota archaeon]|nr:winged helix-turn-helix domain-containing protein [Thermoproteota archaeon]